MSNTVGVGEADNVFSDIAAGAGGAFRRGTADARVVAERTVPVIKRSVGKGVFVFCYYLAFGTVYAAELVMEVVPDDSPIRRGLAAGAESAHEARGHRHRHHHVIRPDEPAADESGPFVP